MTKLGEIAEITVGFAFKSKDFTEFHDDIRLARGENIGQGDLKWLRTKRWPQNRSKEFEKYLLREGDLLIAMDGMIVNAGLKFAVVRLRDLPALLVQRVARVRSIAGSSNQEYLNFLVSNSDFENYVKSVQTGSVIPHISATQIADFEIGELPSIEVQNQIGAILKSIDSRIETNKTQISIALELALLHAEKTFDSRPLVSYTNACAVRMGSSFKSEMFCEPGVGRPLLRIRDLRTFTPQIWTSECRDDEVTIHPGNIVVGMDAEFRATLWLGPKSVLNQRVCSFSPVPGVSRAFVLAALARDLDYFEKSKTATTVIHLNKADIDKFEVPEISAEEHHQLQLVTEPLVEIAVARSSEIQSLRRLRSSLIPELLSVRKYGSKVVA